MTLNSMTKNLKTKDLVAKDLNAKDLKTKDLKTKDLKTNDRLIKDRLTPDFSVKIGPLTLKNPIIAASGVFGYGLELADFCPPEKLGAAICKGISLTPWPGNPGPRAAKAGAGLINAIGLENVGVKAFLESRLPPLKETGATVGANAVGRTVEEYARLAEILADSALDFLELNVSCPNVEKGGLSFGGDPDILARLTSAAVKNAGSKPVMVKLPPLAADIGALAKIAEDSGASAISLINSVPALLVNAKTRRAILGNIAGGLSGPPIKHLALRQVWLCAKAVAIPVVGLGGIMTAEDVAEFIVAGASAVQIGTAILADPAAPIKILADLEEFFVREKISSLESLRGTLKGPSDP
jgi:dihydroorotate dehydrogenase (NAD+) catalytic subunit